MFLLKKIISRFFFPVPLCVIIGVTALYFLWFTQRQKAGKILASVGVVLLFLLSFGPVADLLLGRLEYRYPAVLDPQQVSHVKYVIVLSGGSRSDPNVPPTSQVGPSSLVRTIEGIRIQRQVPGSKLVLCGGKIFEEDSEAEGMRKIAQAVGVPPEDIILEDKSRDTKDQARMVSAIIGQEPSCLVTCALHMPRAMAMFHKQGMDPIPAPTGHTTGKERRFHITSIFPNAGDLARSERAVYEYLGLVWAKLRGLI